LLKSRMLSALRHSLSIIPTRKLVRRFMELWSKEAYIQMWYSNKHTFKLDFQISILWNAIFKEVYIHMRYSNKYTFKWYIQISIHSNAIFLLRLKVEVVLQGYSQKHFLKCKLQTISSMRKFMLVALIIRPGSEMYA